ncbi:MAG: polyprenyl synthetase family protein [Deltaproteobacteria bacterium]|nr:polyprenyl synthetase family protein [Deltaproteobacteria bacterium]
MRKINAFLARLFETRKENQPPAVLNLLNAMEYTVNCGGKRVRPLFALAAAGAVGDGEDRGLPGAAAVELVHSYSLIHDDLPALDDDDLRRGNPSCHKAFGEDVAILAGDALQALAFETISRPADDGPEARSRACLATGILARAAGPLCLVGGQAMDLAFEPERPGNSRPPRETPSFGDAESMAERKTGELMAASLGVGGALAGANASELDDFRKIGLLCGTAFQITDDLLNLRGDPRLMGKAAGTDEKRGKTTILSLAGAENAREKARELNREALGLAKRFDSDKLNFLIDSSVNRSF